MKIIINADDCGKSTAVDKAIAHFIEEGKLTSTTVMANMEDLNGAVELYKEHHNHVSFGMHLNLTEGHPLTYSQELLDKGYFREDMGGVLLDASHLRNELVGKSVQRELEKELCAQIEWVLDSGIRISHFDSHHHIHTSMMLIRLMPILAERYGINKMRRMRNFVPGASKVNIAMRNFWKTLIKIQHPSIVSTDYFCGYLEWHDSGMPRFAEHATMELMCHPGAGNVEEDGKLLAANFPSNVSLITYNDL